MVIQLLIFEHQRSLFMKRKTFEAVKFMREIRDELSRKYLKDPKTQDKDLIQIRKKYNKLRSNNSKEISRNIHAST